MHEQLVLKLALPQSFHFHYQCENTRLGADWSLEQQPAQQAVHTAHLHSVRAARGFLKGHHHHHHHQQQHCSWGPPVNLHTFA